MADEWNFAQTTFDATTEGRAALLDKIQTFLLGSGWELASWSNPAGTDANRWLLRADRGTSDVWHYTGDGILQHCGIGLIADGGDTDRITIGAFLQNEAGDNYQGISKYDEGRIRIFDWDPTKVHDILMIGGEDGLYFEMGHSGTPGSSAQGIVVTHQAWDFLNGTRVQERKFSTQGIVMDMFGTIRFSGDRNYRVVMNDGLNTNLTGYLYAYLARGVNRVRAAQSPFDDVRFLMGSFDSFMEGGARPGGSVSDVPWRAHVAHFGLPFTPFDDRWAISPMVALQGVSDVAFTQTHSTSASNVAPPSPSYCQSLAWRDALRLCPKFAVLGHLLTPWQLITDTQTGKEYRVVQGDDSGRAFNLGVEWPGAGNEVTI